MTVITCTSENLWGSLRDLLIAQFDAVKRSPMNIRILGEFNYEDKVSVLGKLDQFGIAAKYCDVYRSAIDEENRMELLVDIKHKVKK